LLKKSMAYRCTILLLLLGGVAQQSIGQPRSLQGIDTAIDRALRQLHAPGCAVAVVHKQSVVFVKGYGYRNKETRQPVDTNTVFAIGSCTKAFTAALIGWLADAGKLDIDQPVTQLLPQLQFNKPELNSMVTLRDMMCHRTGLPRHDMAWVDNHQVPRDSLVYRIRFFEPSAGIREKWQYNNFMYLLQGAVAAHLTGQSWEQLIQQRFIEPLGLRHTSLAIAALQDHPNHALPYMFKTKDSTVVKVPYLKLDNMGPAGSINSTVTDMAKWVLAWINGGKYRGKTVVPTAHHTAAISSQMSLPNLPDPQYPDIQFDNYGFGWGLDAYRGHYRVEHGGNVNGYSANICFMPYDSIGVVVLCNQNSSAVPSAVRNLILDRMLGLKPLNWADLMAGSLAKMIAAAKAKRQGDTTEGLRLPPLHSLDQLAGVYTNEGYGHLQVMKVKDSLRMLFNNNIYHLRHKTADVYMASGDEVVTDGIESPVLFRYGTSGEVNELTVGNLEPAAKAIIFTKKPSSIKVDTVVLRQYVGQYELNGTAMQIYLKGSGSLYLAVPGQPHYELVPTAKDAFRFASPEGFSVVFNRDGQGKLSSFLLKQPQGNYTVKRKE
jgi:CubicO group peptidase (beta-lactamase class C family)